MPALVHVSSSLHELDSSEQLREVQQFEKVACAGDKPFYLISLSWWQAWQAYCAGSQDTDTKSSDQGQGPAAVSAAHPGPIDNSCLRTDNSAELLPDLQEGKDFLVVAEGTWSRLSKQYGSVGDPILRKAVSEGLGSVKRQRIMVYPSTVIISCPSKGSEKHKVSIEKQATIQELKAKACELCGVTDESDWELVDVFKGSQYTVLDGSDADRARTLQEARIVLDNHILLRPKDSPDAGADASGSDQDEADSVRANQVPDSTAAAAASPAADAAASDAAAAVGPLALRQPHKPVPRAGVQQLQRPGSGSFGGFGRSGGFGGGGGFGEDSVMHGNRPAGLVGLSNLGNTCFMNSSLQCLAHAPPLMRAFLSGRYKGDLNRTNPLGMKGELAESFGRLMDAMWAGGVTSVSPRGFKARIGRFAPQFSGYSQHDSQEFLAFLLDGLHEDLNRIHKKPYIEDKDSDGRPDEVVATEAWSNYRARNDSLIVDHFQGLYKSTVDCPRCGFNSVKFDPFMYLSLPLPESRMRTLVITLVHADGSARPKKYAIEVSNTGSVRDVLHAVARAAGIAVAPPPLAPSSKAGSVVSMAAAAGAAVDGSGSDAEVADGQQQQLPLAEEILVCAKVSRSWTWAEEVEVFTDLRTRVPEIVPSDRHSSPEFLLVYKYPSRETGPKGVEDAEPVCIHHRMSRRKYFAAPLVLWASKDQAPVDRESLVERAPSSSTNTFSSAAKELVVPSDSPLLQHLLAALRPFAASAAPPSAEPAEPAADAAEQQQRGQDAADPATGASDAAGSIADVEMADGPAADAAEAAAAPADADGGSDAAAGGAAAAGPQSAPFDMWAAQEPQQEAPAAPQQAQPLQEAAGAGAGAPGAPPFTLLGARSNRETNWYKHDLKDLEPHELRVFVADWGSAAESLGCVGGFDLDAMEAPDADSSFEAHVAAARQGKAPVSLSACVEAFLQPEQLSAEDTWYCPRCKDHVQADKKLDLWRLPEVLVVHLKRFSYTRHSRDKLETLVDFPLEGLDLGQYVMRQQDVAPVYDCFAVSNHFGSLGGGHYTAYAKMPGAGWQSFDDSHVSPVGESESVVSTAAYVLFYRRRAEAACDPAGGEMLQQLAEQREEADAKVRAAEGDAACDHMDHDQDNKFTDAPIRARASAAAANNSSNGNNALIITTAGAIVNGPSAGVGADVDISAADELPGATGRGLMVSRDLDLEGDEGGFGPGALDTPPRSEPDLLVPSIAFNPTPIELGPSAGPASMEEVQTDPEFDRVVQKIGDLPAWQTAGALGGSGTGSSAGNGAASAHAPMHGAPAEGQQRQPAPGGAAAAAIASGPGPVASGEDSGCESGGGGSSVACAASSRGEDFEELELLDIGDDVNDERDVTGEQQGQQEQLAAQQQ